MKKLICSLLAAVAFTSAIHGEDVIHYATAAEIAAQQRAEAEAKRRSIRIGMTMAQCLALWGAPERTRQMTTASGVSSSWYYSDGKSLSFDDSILRYIHE